MSFSFAKKHQVTVTVCATALLVLPAMEASGSTRAAVAESAADQALQNYMKMCGEGIPDIASDMLDMRAEGATRAQVKRDALWVHDDGMKKRRADLNDLKTQTIERGLTHRGATAIVAAMEQMLGAVYSTLPDMADAVFDGDRGRRWSKRRFRRYALEACVERVGLVTESLARAVHQASTDAPRKTPASGRCVPPGHGADMAVWFNFEHCLRIRRFKRLAVERREKIPIIENLAQEGLLDYPIPAARISWSDSVFFDTDSDEVLEKAKGKLRLVANAMSRDVGDIHLFVIGHTDDTGGRKHNQKLSERRALNVLRELSALDVPKAQMTAAGMGELQPVTTNHTHKGRAANRRVEFMISPYAEANFALTMAREVDEAFFRPIAVARDEVERLPIRGDPFGPLAPSAQDGELLAEALVEKVSVLSLEEKELKPLSIPDERPRALLSVPGSQG